MEDREQRVQHRACDKYSQERAPAPCGRVLGGWYALGCPQRRQSDERRDVQLNREHDRVSNLHESALGGLREPLRSGMMGGRRGICSSISTHTNAHIHTHSHIRLRGTQARAHRRHTHDYKQASSAHTHTHTHTRRAGRGKQREKSARNTVHKHMVEYE